MSGLSDAVSAAFAPQGLLAKTYPQFQARIGQIDMAMAVADTIEQGGSLVVEAGTGIGKTFAYLVPALLSGKRVMVSTATKALQDQLYTRDLPQLMAAMGLPIKRAVLKGRSNYLCLYRLGHARQNIDSTETNADSSQSARQLALVEQWSHHTTTGDMNELPGLAEQSAVWGLVTSTTANCLNAQCPAIAQCHLYKARHMAAKADVVVINHHLLFADGAVRAQGDGELLASAAVVIVDEAHQINDIGVQFLGVQLSAAQLLAFAQELEQTIAQAGNGLQQGRQLKELIQHAVDAWQVCAHGLNAPNQQRQYWDGIAPQGSDAAQWTDAMELLLSAMQTVSIHLQQRADLGAQSGMHHPLNSLHPAVLMLRKADLYASYLEQFLAPVPENAVRWLELRPTFRMIQVPLHIADAVKALQLAPANPSVEVIPNGDSLVRATGPQAQPNSLSTAWIFTSATLGLDAQLSWFTQPCGLSHLPQNRIVRVESPFDYPHQAALYIPDDWPEPQDTQAHSAAVADWVAQAASTIGGRTLVLTTTHQAIISIARHLQDNLAERNQAGEINGARLEVIVQGADSKVRTMERFRLANSQGQGGCILVATTSFWEGFDVPGDALQLVVIDKLPFAPPDDPWMQAHNQRLKNAGKNAFKDYVLPDVAMKLKQGAGRLIRHENDRGLLVIGDTRLLSKGYGKKILAPLPPMQRLANAQAAELYLSQLGVKHCTDDVGVDEA